MRRSPVVRSESPAVLVLVAEWLMLVDLLRALCAAAAAIVLPGYFWAGLLRPTSGLGERLGYACALSLSTVPVVALLLAGLSRSGITLWIAITSASLGVYLANGVSGMFG